MTSKAIAPPNVLVGRTGKHARVAILTVTERELKAVQTVIPNLVLVKGTARSFTLAECVDDTEIPVVVTRARDQTNIVSHATALEIVGDFRPEFLLLVGTAGGILRPERQGPRKAVRWKGPNLCDVVVSRYIHHTDYMKATAEHGKLARYNPFEQPGCRLRGYADHVSMQGTWRDYLTPHWGTTEPLPNIIFDEILCGDGLRADPNDDFQRWVVKHFDHSAAIEMESVGVASALYDLRDSEFYGPTFLTIRGISDHVHGPGPDGDFPNDKIPRKSQNRIREQRTPFAALAAAAYATAVAAEILREPSRDLVARPPILPFSIRPTGAAVK